MAIIYGSLNPPAAATYLGSSILNGTATGADGDVFVRTTGTNPQWRFTAARTGPPAVTAVWTQIVPPNEASILAAAGRIALSDTRADIVPPGGQLNERLAKVANDAANVEADRPWALGWAGAADGVVIEPVEQTAPLTEWVIQHNLGFEIVDIEVIGDDGTVHYPEVVFDTPMRSILKFRVPVAGKAVIRR